MADRYCDNLPLALERQHRELVDPIADHDPVRRCGRISCRGTQAFCAWRRWRRSMTHHDPLRAPRPRES
ncbi:hypothetical protein M8756_04940 [Lutimaribacter sp. EGI FJ00015]|nr:hypothetical protein [Lutimaribacter sp. EGI FJ00015]MCO0635302.1 hypothetical protein [Lutimaribacter sp. EGI FJ00014]